MSVLNDMLRNLEARGAGAAPPAVATQPLAQAVLAARRGRPALWVATVGGALLIAGSVYWSLQGQPQPLPGSNTQRAAPDGERATQAAGSATVEAAAATVAPPAEATPVAAALAASAPERSPLPIEATAFAPGPSPATTATRAPQADRAPARAQPAVPPAAANATSAAPAASTGAEVRRSSASRGDPEAELARAAELIARGRNSEAMPLLQQILDAHPRQANARQALATLQFETGQPLQSLVTLLDGAALDPGSFAVPAAQLQAALGDVAGALATLEQVPASARTPQQHALHGGLAHRLGRHALAVDSYRLALRSPPASSPPGQAAAQAVWWLGLGLAHEGAAQPEAAREALKQALAQTSLAPEQRSFAQQRLLAMRAGEPRVNSLAAAAP